MKDGYTDNYYMQMIQNIRKYKGVIGFHIGFYIGFPNAFGCFFLTVFLTVSPKTVS